MRLAAKQLSIFLLCAVFLLCLYRAATQSFTIDESFTFLHYVNVSFSQAMSEYSANNHVLQSLLMRVFRRLLGRSELVMRLPTLIGCVLYLTAVYGITVASIRNGWLRLLALAVMTLNPLVLDLLVAARGYALSLGLSWWALYLAWSDLLEPKPRRLWLAGVCAGLAVTANLIFVIPLAALGLMLMPLYARRGRFWHLIDSYAGPAVIICFVFLFIPLLKSAGQFYFGVATLRDTFGSLFGESLRQPPAGSFIFDNLDRMIPDVSAHLAAVAAPLVIKRGHCPAGPCFGLHCIVCWLLDRREPDVRHRISDDSDSVIPPAAGWVRDGAIRVCIAMAHRFRSACVRGGGSCCHICG
jgi:4-amino-4-deoxy-L-arabinose transferase-like glycosyltransferase